MAASTGMVSRLSINGQAYDFHAATVGVSEQILDNSGLRGSLSHDISRVRPGIRRVGGQLRFEPNVAESTLLNTWAMGGATLTDASLNYAVVADKVAKVATYATVGVNRATW